MFNSKLVKTTLKNFTIFSLCSLLWGQINTEAMRKGDLLPGLHTSLNLDIAVVAGNSNLSRIQTNIRFDYLSGTTHSFLVSGFQNGRQGQDNTLFIRKGFVHLRQTRAIGSIFYLEGFLQKEFDRFIRLKDRNLLGGGLRIHLLETSTIEERESSIKLFTGLGFMWEQERIDVPENSLTNILRSTNYLVIRWEPDTRVLLQLTTYFQPDVERFSDFRVLVDGGLVFALTDRLTVSIKFYTRYDHEPPKSVKKYDIELSNGLTYNF